MEDRKINYLTQFLLDNEFDTTNIPKKNKQLIKNIEKERKKRILVELEFLFNKSQQSKIKIYRFINKSRSEDIDSGTLYELLENKTLNSLNKLLESCR